MLSGVNPQISSVLKSHVWLNENRGHSLDSVLVELNHWFDLMPTNLLQDESNLNGIIEYLFDLLEVRILFQSLEYLALKLLNGMSDSVHSELANKYEKYRAMKIGNTASDILFPGKYPLSRTY